MPQSGHPNGEQSTRARVARSILLDGHATASALAEKLELTPAAVRRHLDQLLADGLIETRELRPVGHRGRGRPAKVFALTEAGRNQFEQQYDDLAVQALRFLAETGGDEAVREFAQRRVDFIEPRFHEISAAEPGLAPVAVLARVLSDEGYAAGVHDGPVGEQLCQQHCPVSHVAHEFPQLCEAETEAIAKVLDSHVQRLATIAHGDGVCTTCIPSTGDHSPEHPSGNAHSFNKEEMAQ